MTPPPRAPARPRPDSSALQHEPSDAREKLLLNLERKKIPGLDGLRAIAALSVVGFHDHYLARHGWFGRIYPGRFAVQVFFIISGFLITWLLLREQRATGAIDRFSFYTRRALRLFPPLLLLLAWEHFVHIPAAGRGPMIATALYVANYYGIFHGGLAGLGQTWSLAVEEHFYLIWPQIFVLVRNRRSLLRGCLVVAALQILWRVAAGLHGSYIYAELATETASCAALLGCAAALLIWHYPGRLPRWVLRPWFTPVSVLAIVALAQLPRNVQLFWGIPLGIPFGLCIVLQAITWEWRILENPVLEYLGQISYGVYLWGMVAIALVEKIGHDPLNVPPMLLAILFATISWYGLERPVQIVGRRWLARRASSTESTDPALATS